MPISSPHFPALGIARKASRPALVHGVPDVVIDRYRDGGVTGDPLHRFAIDQANVLELAGQDGLLA